VYFAEKNRIILYPALLKKKAMDFLIREATAIGVAEIIPIITEHSLIKIDGKAIAEKQFHWNNIAKEACKQSGNPNLPYIEIPQPIEQINFTRPTVVASLQKVTKDIFFYKDIIVNGTINLMIGPEGDFSEREYQYFLDRNAHFVYLGRNILRSETAALYLLSVIDHILLTSAKRCHEYE
jgi:16S rRNA (uracil1498-N3)-methyltransferase